MDHLQQFIRTTRAYTYLLIVCTNLILISLLWIATEKLFFDGPLLFALMVLLAAVLPMAIVPLINNWYVRPLQFVWQAVLFLAPETSNVAAPDTKNIHYAKALVENLVRHIYQLADVSKNIAKTNAESANEIHTNFVANSMPLPLVILDDEENILFANNAMAEYIGRDIKDTEKQNLYSVLDFSFTNDNTLDTWLSKSKADSATATRTWERVRLKLPGEQPKTLLFDLVAYYNKSNPSGYETMLMLFDRSEEYGKEDQAVSYVALAVHELRTPLTMLRGYIEALEEELEGKIDPELTGFLQKTQVAANQLATFVNNILNIARINDDQMLLKLKEEKWQNVLADALTDLSVRAEVRGIKITHDIQADLPPVGLDRVSMYEVMSNLIDNAIKYSGTSKEIIIRAKLGQDGIVETTVQDFGTGIPTSAIPQLFTKFYRDPHNRDHVAGTGIGLYLCKTFVNAHGGNIWVRSHEGEGSTFGFTLIPYSNIAKEAKSNDNTEIVRNAHGWIKNHTLYRR